MMMRLAVFAGAIFLGGCMYVYDMYDKGVNYMPVDARATSVKSTCYMEKKEGRTTYTSDTLDCNLAKVAVEDHPKWRGYNVKSNISVEFIYASPVDSKWHKGKLQMSSFPDDKTISNGENFKIRASRSNADKYRSI